MAAGVLAEYRTQAAVQEQGYITISSEVYGNLIAEKVRLEYELQQARQELAERKTAETLTSEILEEIRGCIADSEAKKQKEIQIPAFVNSRHRR
jgi:predicted CopG family antitoxin